ncbi:hypothetical protein M8C21_030436, partial [Ambrosia artemisiifolia]
VEPEAEIETQNKVQENTSSVAETENQASGVNPPNTTTSEPMPIEVLEHQEDPSADLHPRKRSRRDPRISSGMTTTLETSNLVSSSESPVIEVLVFVEPQPIITNATTAQGKRAETGVVIQENPTTTTHDDDGDNMDEFIDDVYQLQQKSFTAGVAQVINKRMWAGARGHVEETKLFGQYIVCTIIMPRKPTKSGRLRNGQPAFSRLARSCSSRFCLFYPKPDDFHEVKVLLQTYLDNKEWDLSSFVDLILQQTTVGTVVTIEEDEDNGVCQGKDIKEKLRSYFGEQAEDVGLVIAQLVVNLPPQLLPPLYDGLFDEISWAIEDELSACFPLHTQQLKDYRSTGLVMAVEATRVPNFRQQLHQLLDES